MPLDKKTAAQSDRVPPNQRLTEGFPVLHYGEVPQVNLDTWDLRIFGFVDKEIMYTWEQILDMPHTASANDIHCVTGWSKLDNTWEGVLVKNVLREIEILPEAKFVMIHAEEGWTANLPLEDFMREASLFARKHNGEDFQVLLICFSKLLWCDFFKYFPFFEYNIQDIINHYLGV
ncbi:molybdopterin-dependent oxidoreductase [Aneurinibacillus tyrosinisolvens]|uniref:molybdopterin-dependent oxidoreductase n=1 Tax=Aneurinibacillus tyrosinisolvens TaxID=1443435 RepID=UPI00069A8884|nr:molybdopterin-dependent oxidoreductase [Aneurinibacillus tyrosinisolvens]